MLITGNTSSEMNAKRHTNYSASLKVIRTWLRVARCISISWKPLMVCP